MLPDRFVDQYFQVNVLLSCYRAWRDAQHGIESLEKQLEKQETFLWEWRVTWVAICSLLRASIHLIGHDANGCHNKFVADELRLEWQNIANERDKHTIYWEFINKERNAILKEYQWSAYERYLDENGNPVTSTGLAALILTSSKSELIMRHGKFQGRSCIEVVKEASDWVHERIEAAVKRAGYSLTEQVHFRNWTKKPTLATSNTLLGQMTSENGDNG